MRKNISKKLFLTLVIFIIYPGEVQAKCTPNNQPGHGEYSQGKYSYECNVENLCLGQRYGGDYWNFDTGKQLIVEHNMGKYPNLAEIKSTLSFDDIRKIYQDTQNNILNCAVLKSKYTLHKKIIDDYEISKKAKKALEKANDIILEQIKEHKCIEPRDGDKIYNFKDLLDSLTYEQCGYNMYLWYFQNAAANDITLYGSGKKIYTAAEWSEVVGTEKNKISAEFELSRRAMDTALSLYENFEKTYIAHVLLEMIEIELTEQKRFMGITTEALKQLTSLMKNAQKSQGAK